MTIDGPVLQGRNGRILTNYFMTDASPESPAPVILFCHGFPGTDLFEDLCLLLQRSGFHVMMFHYSGSWGSDGNYSLENGLADTETVLQYLEQPSPSREGTTGRTIDRSRIGIIGYSLGGFFAAHTFARHPEIRCAAFLSPGNIANMAAAVQNNPEAMTAFRSEISAYCAPLNGVTADSLMEEIKQHQNSYQFSAAVPAFGTRPTLIVRGSRDDVTPAPLCADVLKKGLDQIPGSQAELLTFDTDHGYLNVREELLKAVLEFEERTLRR